MAAWAVGHTDRFAAAVMGAGVSDWGMLAATGEWGVFETALGGSTSARLTQPDLLRLDDPYPGVDRARSGRHQRAGVPG
jgi:dipeptidyl aminopeptidase/acylaminoacyl peptidase